MSGSNAKHIRVAVLAHDGGLLGYVQRRPHNTNWRILGTKPTVTLHKKGGARGCFWNRASNVWRVWLRENETPPSDLEAP